MGDVDIDNVAAGRIIALVAATPNVSVRLRPNVLAHVDDIARRQKRSRKEVLEMAAIHYISTLLKGQPVYPELPDEPVGAEPPSHKRRRGAA